MELDQRHEGEAQASQALEDQGSLVATSGRLEMIQKDEALRTMLEIGKAAGRVQGAQIFGHVANSIQVSQLRRLKEMHKAAGLSWPEACEIVGIARRTADRYLTLADDLGDEFFGHCGQLGLSVRTMDAARQLPEPVRQALAQGEVVDLEDVTKEALTGVITQLVREHGKEKEGLEAALKREQKNASRAVDKHIEAARRASALEQEVEALREGLTAEDREALELILAEERRIIPWLVRLKNTTYLEGRDPHFVARLVNHLNLIGELALATGLAINSLANGEEPDEERINTGARMANQACAAYDHRDPYPGV